MKTKPFKIMSFGEILWDMLPGGKKVGGAPANFAYHCRQLGGDVRILSRVGNDPLGEEILEYCTQRGLSTELIGRDDSAPTGTVDVHLGQDGQATYTINTSVAWDRIEADDRALAWARGTDVIAFGSLAARSEQNRSALQKLIDATGPETMRVLDLNLRDPFCEKPHLEFVLAHADILKLNDEELVRVTDLFELGSSTPEEQAKVLRDRFRFRSVIVTCGADGSLLTTESEQVRAPGVRVQVVDTVGAGDSFTAAVVMGLLYEKPLEEIADRAGRLGAYVCTRSGGTPPIPAQWRWDE